MVAARKLTCSACGQRFATPPAGAEATCPGCGATTPLTALATRVGAQDTADAGLVGSTIAGFKLVEFLGAGGMGLVFEAHRTEAAEIDSPPRVAIKLLAKELADNPDFVARFTRESSALAKIEHNNLIRVYGAGAAGDQGPYFYLMERFDGSDLQEVLRKGTPCIAEARSILLGAATGLAHAHEAGVVHRDVKPGNILVAGEVAGGGAVKVVDFGVAQWAPLEQRLTSLTRSDHLLGTLNYMAPEQRLAATSVDGRADVYALAVVAYEMLTGRLPLGVFERPSQLRPELPRRIDAVLWAALHRDPARRTPSMAAFAQAVDKALQPPSRVPWVAIGAAAVLGLYAAGSALMPPDSAKDKAIDPKATLVSENVKKKAPPPIEKKAPRPVEKIVPTAAERVADVLVSEAALINKLAAAPVKKSTGVAKTQKSAVKKPVVKKPRSKRSKPVPKSDPKLNKGILDKLSTKSKSAKALPASNEDAVGEAVAE